MELDGLHKDKPPKWIELSTRPKSLLSVFVVATFLLVGIGSYRVFSESNQSAPGVLVETQSGIRCATIANGILQIDGIEIDSLKNAIFVDSC